VRKIGMVFGFMPAVGSHLLLHTNEGIFSVTNLMKLKNTLRTLLGIRVEREPLPPGPKPQIGSNIVRDKLRIRLKYPVNDEQWEWFTEKGWRTIDMRSNRRRYVSVPDKLLMKFLDADSEERELLHRRLLKVPTKRVTQPAPPKKRALRHNTIINTLA
jgi:hypothetical protein